MTTLYDLIVMVQHSDGRCEELPKTVEANDPLQAMDLAYHSARAEVLRGLPPIRDPYLGCDIPAISVRRA